MTTAASIWSTAALGVGVGAGEYWVGVGGAVLILDQFCQRIMQLEGSTRSTAKAEPAVSAAPRAWSGRFVPLRSERGDGR